MYTIKEKRNSIHIILSWKSLSYFPPLVDSIDLPRARVCELVAKKEWREPQSQLLAHDQYLRQQQQGLAFFGFQVCMHVPSTRTHISQCSNERGDMITGPTHSHMHTYIHGKNIFFEIGVARVSSTACLHTAI